jgi:tetratricopeptide (TPR) repeat protein
MRLRTQALFFFASLSLLWVTSCTSPPEDRLDQIRAMQDAGQVDESIEPLIEMIEEGDRRGETLYRYGRALSLSGRPGRAVWALDAALADPNWFVHASHQLAMNAASAQNHDLALAALRRLREERADDPDEDIPARLLEIRVLLESRRKYEEALEQVEALLDDHPDLEEAVRMKGVALLGLGEADEAYELMLAASRMLDETAGNVATDGDLAYLTAEDPESPDDAGADSIPDSLSTAENVPGAGESYWCTVRATFKREAGEVTEAEQILTPCLEIAPADPGLVNEAVNIYSALRRGDRIIEVAKAAWELEPDSTDFRNLLIAHLKAFDRHDEAETLLRESLDRILAADPPRRIRAAETWVELAGFLLERDRVEDGLEAYERALALLGEDASAELLFRFADALILAKRYERALEVIDPSPVEVYPPMIRGRVAFERGDFETALSELDRAALLWPDNGPTRYYLARAAESVGDFDRAVEEYRQAIRSEPSMLPARERLVRLNLAEGRVRDAATILLFASPKKGGEASLSNELKLLGVEIDSRLGIEPDLSLPPSGSTSIRKLQAQVLEAMGRGFTARAGREEAIKVLDALKSQVAANTQDLFVLVEVDLLLREQSEEATRLAVQIARNANSEMPNHPIIHLALARALVNAGTDLDEAEALLDSVLEADPDRPDALASRGDLSRLRSDASQALVDYEAALEESPGQWQAVFGRAAALKMLGQMDAARKALESYLLDQNPYDGRGALELALTLDEAQTARRIALARRALRFGGGERAEALLAQLDPEADKQANPRKGS